MKCLKVKIKVMQDSASSYYLILQEFVFCVRNVQVTEAGAAFKFHLIVRIAKALVNANVYWPLWH